MPTIGAEFSIEHFRQVNSSPQLEITLDSTSSTPYLDAVYQVINAPRATLNTDEEEDLIEEKPKIAATRTLGIKTPNKAPAHVTIKGVHIYTANPKQARVLEKVCCKFPTLWEDTSPINVLLKQRMKIPLVDNYLDVVKLNSQPYPLSQKDCTLLDKKHNLLYKQERLS